MFSVHCTLHTQCQTYCDECAAQRAVDNVKKESDFIVYMLKLAEKSV